MGNRRNFIKSSVLGAIGVGFSSSVLAKMEPEDIKIQKPIVLSTWNHGLDANKGAWEVLGKGGKSLDAVQKGVAVTEDDLTNRSVGLSGNPDREGKVTLDACLMDEKSRCGSVAFLQSIDHPIDVARKIMDETPHVMLVGEGAYQWALKNGFRKTEKQVPHPDAQKNWENWLEESKYQPQINVENHDTIGMIAMDVEGNLSGACTTSGMAYKIHGRVGDSPIIGAGLFVDNEVGAATATGVGEAVIRVAGSHTVVELMRHGASPFEACKEAVERILRKHDNVDNLQVGFIALDKYGNHGGYSVYEGFNYALKTNTEEKMVDAQFMKKW